MPLRMLSSLLVSVFVGMGTDTAPFLSSFMPNRQGAKSSIQTVQERGNREDQVLSRDSGCAKSEQQSMIPKSGYRFSDKIMRKKI
jgi:hypothetical protein